MLPHNIKEEEKANHIHLGQSCRVCDTTEEHDCCVAEMINSKRGLNTLAVFDKSTNTLTRKSGGVSGRHNGMDKSMEFQNILMTHADKDTKHVMVHIKPSVDDRRRRENM